MADRFIHFRSTPELDEMIDGEVERLREGGVPDRIANKSAVARTLLLRSLGVPKETIVAEEVLRRVWSVAQSVTNQAVQLGMQAIPDLLEAELNSLES